MVIFYSFIFFWFRITSKWDIHISILPCANHLTALYFLPAMLFPIPLTTLYFLPVLPSFNPRTALHIPHSLSSGIITILFVPFAATLAGVQITPVYSPVTLGWHTFRLPIYIRSLPGIKNPGTCALFPYVVLVHRNIHMRIQGQGIRNQAERAFYHNRADQTEQYGTP